MYLTRSSGWVRALAAARGRQRTHHISARLQGARNGGLECHCRPPSRLGFRFGTARQQEGPRLLAGLHVWPSMPLTSPVDSPTALLPRSVSD